MTERKIEPALTAESVDICIPFRSIHGDYVTLAVQRADIPAVIAAANAALPDSDPRKITREIVALLRDVAGTVKRDDHDADVQWNDERLTAFADALESYLQPEKL